MYSGSYLRASQRHAQMMARMLQAWQQATEAIDRAQQTRLAASLLHHRKANENSRASRPADRRRRTSRRFNNYLLPPLVDLRLSFAYSGRLVSRRGDTSSTDHGRPSDLAALSGGATCFRSPNGSARFSTT